MSNALRISILLLTLTAPAFAAETDVIKIWEMNGTTASGAPGQDRVLFENRVAPRTTRLWNSLAETFDGNWENITPDARYQKIDLISNGRQLILRSSHRLDAVKDDNPATAKKRLAFDAVLNEFEKEAKFQREEAPLLLKAAAEHRTKQKYRLLRGNITGYGYGFLFLGAFSLLWYGPLSWCRSSALKRSRSPLVWSAVGALLSPLAWFAMLGLTHVRWWMVISSIAGPLACVLILNFLPTGSVDVKRSKAASWALTAALAGFALWSAFNASTFIAYTSTGSSGEKGTLGKLGGLRSSMSIYYGDSEGKYPPHFSDLVPKYVEEIPETMAIARPGQVLHAPSDRVTEFATREPDDRGGWGYVNAPLLPSGAPNPHYGSVFINCTHPSLNGKPMSEF